MALALDLPKDHCIVPIIRHMTRLLLEYWFVADQDIADIEMVLGELASNATRHARSAEGLFHARHDGPGRDAADAVSLAR